MATTTKIFTQIQGDKIHIHGLRLKHTNLISKYGGIFQITKQINPLINGLFHLNKDKPLASKQETNFTETNSSENYCVLTIYNPKCINWDSLNKALKELNYNLVEDDLFTVNSWTIYNSLITYSHLLNQFVDDSYKKRFNKPKNSRLTYLKFKEITKGLSFFPDSKNKLVKKEATIFSYISNYDDFILEVSISKEEDISYLLIDNYLEEKLYSLCLKSLSIERQLKIKRKNKSLDNI